MQDRKTCAQRALFHSFFLSPAITLLIVLIFPIGASGQSGDASISGRVSDPAGNVVQRAEVSIKNVATNVRGTTLTNDAGIYTFPSLAPGDYVLTVHKQGFQSVDLVDLTLYTQDRLERNFALSVGSASESVTVTAGTTNSSPAISMTVNREFVENMPLNGRSFQDLIQLAPGTVSSGGYYSVDGQRTDSNNYTVDGVSANLGGIENEGNVSNVGAGMAGAVPAQTALGTTQSLAALDSLQEFTIQTSGYTAEYGRSPGGQIQFTTRSGTNSLHGTAFEYLRNTDFDANSFSNDYNHLAQTAEHQNDFGGTFGGPVIFPKLYDGRDKSFYFLSYEGLRLLLPSNESEYVPTEAFRSAASPYIEPFLSAAPLPNPGSPGNSDGCTVNGQKSGPACDALFNYAYSYPNNIDSYSARLDQSFGGRFHTFVRYADTPSYTQTGAEQVTTNKINVHGLTAGLTALISKRIVDDFRFNFSHDGEQSVQSLRSIGGSTPFGIGLLVPSAYDLPYSEAIGFISLSGTSLRTLLRIAGTATVQHQYQLIDSVVWTKGAHNIKFGADWRRLTPEYSFAPYASEVIVSSLSNIQNGYATSLVVEANAPGEPIFNNLSLYAQDHWRLGARLSADYGLRWDFNPPPGPSNGFYPAALTSTNLASATLANNGTQPFQTDYHSFGPRFGFAWNVLSSEHHPVTLRGGTGIFFDSAQQVIGQAYAGTYPFAELRPTQSQIQFPLTGAEQAPPSLNVPLVAPYPSLDLSSPDLTAPYTEQWNLSVDLAVNSKNKVTCSYVGNNGRKLLFTQFYGKGFPQNTSFTSPYLTYNGSQSSYNSLEVQDIGKIVKGLDFVGSFVWAHALDDASADFSLDQPVYGNSNNDVRRILNLALNYQTAEFGPTRWTHVLTRGWILANRFGAQSSYPFNLVQATVALPNGNVQYTPDLVPGVPLYLHGQAAIPGPLGWRLNRAAFACTTSGATSGACPGTPTREGTLGRNYVRTPPFWALNTSIQRDFSIYEQLHTVFRVDAFNIFNHPNPNDPQNSLAASNFGYLLAGVGTIGTNNSLYAMGAARSLQLSLKVVF